MLLNIASLFTDTNHTILRDLQEGSGLLQKQLGQYNHISRDFETKFFFETYPPPSGTSIVSFRTASYILTEADTFKIVPRVSAVVPGATDAEVFSVYSDHENLVKYKSAEDDGFQKASRCIRLMVETAPKKAMESWQRWKRIKGTQAFIIR